MQYESIQANEGNVEVMGERFCRRRDYRIDRSARRWRYQRGGSMVCSRRGTYRRSSSHQELF